MKALAVTPGRSGSVSVREVAEPAATDGDMVVQTLAIGICGTDKEIARGDYGEAPPGEDHLIIGHESLGRVLEDPSGTVTPGQLVVGIVRRPCGHCDNCAHGEWDFCRSGDYTERGIRARHGYASQRYRIEPSFAVPIPDSIGARGVLLEPTTVVAKAWEQVDRVGSRATFEPRTVLITGGGPIGLLAAMIGVQRGLDVHVLDQVDSGPKPELVAALGATYHHDGVAALGFSPDVVIECTGVAPVVFDVISRSGPNTVICLTGVSAAGTQLSVDGGQINRAMVLNNVAVVGSVNANRRHYELGLAALVAADASWLDRLITRRVPLESATDALSPQAGDIKVVLELSELAEPAAPTA